MTFRLLISFVMIVSLSPICISSIDAKQKAFQHGLTPVVSVRFFPDGMRFVSADRVGVVKMWDFQSGKTIWMVSFNQRRAKGDFTQVDLESMEVSPDGKSIAVSYLRHGVDRNILDKTLGSTASQRDTVYEPHLVFLDARDGSIQKEIQDRDKIFGSIAFSFDGTRLLLITEILDFDETDNNKGFASLESPKFILQNFDFITEQKSKLFEFAETLWTIQFSPTGAYFVLVGTKYRLKESTALQKIYLYDAVTGRPEHTFIPQLDQTAIAAFSSDGRFLSIGGSVRGGTRVDIWDVSKLVLFNSLAFNQNGTSITKLEFSKDGRFLTLGGGRLVLAGHDRVETPFMKDKGGIVVTQELTSKARRRFRKFKSYVTDIAFSPDESRLIIAMRNGQIVVSDN